MSLQNTQVGNLEELFPSAAPPQAHVAYCVQQKKDGSVLQGSCPPGVQAMKQVPHLRNSKGQLSGARLGASVRIERGKEGGAGGGNVAEQEHLRRGGRVVGRAPQREVCRPPAVAERSAPQHVAVPAVYPKHFACRHTQEVQAFMGGIDGCQKQIFPCSKIL